MKTAVLSCVLLVISNLVLAQSSVLGLWKTIDDESGKEKSVVEIFEKDGMYYGKVVKLFREADEDENPLCDECSTDDDRYNQPVIGMEIIRDLKKDDDEFQDGTIMDPENGNIYDCKLWIEDDKLQVRGYIAFFFRTQVWLRYTP